MQAQAPVLDGLGDRGYKAEHVGRYCFLTERQVGIGSAAAAIEPFVRADPGVVWTDITYAKSDGWLERLPLPPRVRGTLRGIEQASSTLRRGPFDALFFLTHNPAIFQWRALATTPALLWTDVTPLLLDQQAAHYEHPVERFESVARFKHFLVHRTFQAAALCVGWSEWARRSFVTDYGVDEQRTAVVPPGIDLSRWLPGERREQAPDRLPRLLFVGGDFMRKGGDVLLDVFRSELRGRCELDLVTRSPIDEEPGVRVHRNLSAGDEKLMELYRSAAAFVLPTRGDCFSIASMEAMAMRLPVVVSDVGGISEIVDERTGFLIGPGDGRSLRLAIDELLGSSERRAELGMAGRLRVEERFSAEGTAKSLLALVARSAAEGRARPHAP